MRYTVVLYWCHFILVSKFRKCKEGLSRKNRGGLMSVGKASLMNVLHGFNGFVGRAQSNFSLIVCELSNPTRKLNR